MDVVKHNRLALAVAWHAEVSPNRPALIQDDRTVGYGELHQLAQEAARALLASGVRRGDRVGVLLGNQLEWVVMSLASSLVGAAFVPLNTWYKAAELEWTLRHCGVAFLLAATRFLKVDFAATLLTMVPEAQGAPVGGIRSERFPELRSLVLQGPDRPSGTIGWHAWLGMAGQIGNGDLAAASGAVAGAETAFILYTSGSTAEPKGVLLNHDGIVANGLQLGIRRGMCADDRVWLGSPLFYGLGAANALPATFTCGAALVLQGHFDAGRAIEVIERAGATVYYGTGNMTRAILDHPDYRQGRVGSLQKGNAGTVAEYKRMTLIELGIRGAVPAYGLTESYGNATVGWPDDPLDAKLETSGTPVDGMEMRIVDPQTGRDLPQGETGLVLLRGWTTPGYFGNPQETAKAIRPDGFFDTGDLGSIDGDGRFRFHARLKEVIKSGGINVSPVEVEQLIACHPGVRDAYVVGVGDPVRGELVVAFVDADAAMSDAEIKDFVKERAANFKVPHHVFFRSEEELPRLASGKVAKFKLAEEARHELGL